MPVTPAYLSDGSVPDSPTTKFDKTPVPTSPALMSSDTSTGVLPLEAQKDLERFVVSLPKAHLHLHLEGAMRPSTLVELAQRHRMPAPPTVSEPDLLHFLLLYAQACQVLKTPADLRRLVFEIAEDQVKSGVHHVEITVDPFLHTDRFLPETWMNMCCTYMQEASQAYALSMAMLVAVDRTRTLDMAWKSLDLALAYRPQVVGLGLAALETGFPPAKFAPVFESAFSHGLKAAVHAGETGPENYIVDAVQVLHATRIGHACSLSNKTAIDLLRAHAVHIECCISSNYALGTASFPHPAKRFLEEGLPISLNCDDPLWFGSSLVDEYVMLAATGVSRSTLEKVARFSMEAVFTQPTV